ncbi:MAG: hypothetical protein Q8907_03300 [Bacteroidota bacterium]|nr:hypothetical protein [Bacteroidota bacterium]MDP4225859.1 hypothetical protein [Bacteroidota bacterium]MDP4273288.1 hypothetical protein [Bacteroidota bacterium]
MGYFGECFEKINYIDYLIRQKNTGAPEDFAEKLQINKDELNEYLNFFRKNFNAPIIFNPQNRTYEYQSPGCLFMGWVGATKQNSRKAYLMSPDY